MVRACQAEGTVRIVVQRPIKSDLGKALDKRSITYQWVIVISMWSARREILEKDPMNAMLKT